MRGRAVGFVQAFERPPHRLEQPAAIGQPCVFGLEFGQLAGLHPQRIDLLHLVAQQLEARAALPLAVEQGIDAGALARIRALLEVSPSR